MQGLGFGRILPLSVEGAGFCAQGMTRLSAAAISSDDDGDMHATAARDDGNDNLMTVVAR